MEQNGEGLGKVVSNIVIRMCVQYYNVAFFRERNQHTPGSRRAGELKRGRRKERKAY